MGTADVRTWRYRHLAVRRQLEGLLKDYGLRTKAGLSQRELEKMVGTSVSAICRLEDADYDGHSLSMLKHIDEGLDKRFEIHFVSSKRRMQPV